MTVRSKLLGSDSVETVGQVLDRHRGIGPGFDLLRMLLAMLILIGHSRWVAGGASLTTMLTGAQTSAAVVQDTMTGTDIQLQQWVGITAAMKLALVPSFFALSGFLVAGSAFRLKTVSTFLAYRGLRIFPALFTEVALSAFVLGPLLTVLALGDYFRNPLLIRYLGNAVGHVWFFLPGVFGSNPVPNIVNVNLWTLPSEFYCYFIAATLMACRALYNRMLFTILLVVTTVALATGHYLTGMSNPAGPFPAHVVVYYFFVGLGFYHWRDRIPARLSFFVMSAAAAYLALSFGALIYVAPIFVTYCTVFFGLFHFKRSKLLTSGDYSYGVYLYGFPISQALVAVFPWFVGRPLPLIAATIAVTVAFAAFSWHCIEKHALKLKKRLSRRWFPTLPKERAAAAATPSP